MLKILSQTNIIYIYFFKFIYNTIIIYESEYDMAKYFTGWLLYFQDPEGSENIT